MHISLRHCQPALGSLPAKQPPVRPQPPRSRTLRAPVAAMSAKVTMHGHYVASLGEALYGRAFGGGSGGGFICVAASPATSCCAGPAADCLADQIGVPVDKVESW